MELKKIIATTIREFLNEQQEVKNNLNKNFWKWFGNSKVVDSNGNPMICYHGSNDNNIKIFNLDLTGKNTDSGMYGKGFYFTDDKKYANTYNRNKNGSVLQVFLRILNPLIITNKNDIPKINVPDDTLDDMYNAPNIYSLKFREYLIKNRYDGVIDDMNTIKQFVVLFPNQIKSIENDGTWDLNDNNIYS
jgi:hypothetical protein